MVRSFPAMLAILLATTASYGQFRNGNFGRGLDGNSRQGSAGTNIVQGTTPRIFRDVPRVRGEGGTALDGGLRIGGRGFNEVVAPGLDTVLANRAPLYTVSGSGELRYNRRNAFGLRDRTVPTRPATVFDRPFRARGDHDVVPYLIARPPGRPERSRAGNATRGMRSIVHISMGQSLRNGPDGRVIGAVRVR